jgi:hypothetical protein
MGDGRWAMGIMCQISWILKIKFDQFLRSQEWLVLSSFWLNAKKFETSSFLRCKPIALQWQVILIALVISGNLS